MRLSLLQLAAFLLPLPALADEPLEEVVVTATRAPAALADYAGSLTGFARSDIEAVNHQHVHELMTRAAGVWLSRGSGQEHLTAIRSPVLTGAGSCGAFLMLEDGIPLRPAGFCNVNQLFELPTELADRIEILRGPANALYGSNALHGTVNALMPQPSGTGFAAIESGANDFLRARLRVPFAADTESVLALVFADDGGFRADSGYRQAKMHAKTRRRFADGVLDLAASATWLDQETAGFIFGEDAYRDPALNRGNVNPEAFRRAVSQRVYAIWSRERSGRRLDIRPYLRHSSMEFLQHFLPGQPLEENGHVSAGFLSMLSGQRDKVGWNLGLDLDLADAFVEQTQSGPTTGSPFLVETRPPGRHYDFDVRSLVLAIYGQADIALTARWSLTAGLRGEYTHYTYRNRMLTGNTRDDGSECGFGGCLYSRPADRSDAFLNVAPNLALRFALSDSSTAYLRLGRGFRAPQMTELYRLQSGQRVADLDSEQLDSVEIGIRRSGERFAVDLAAFAMQKRDSVFRDSEGFNVSGARTRHEGLEAQLDWTPNRLLRLDLDLSYARHRYDFDTIASRGESFVSGRDVDTAPRWLGSAELELSPSETWAFAAQITGMGAYYLDAENRFRYPGHTIGNLRARLSPVERVDVVLRLNNVTDRSYADRADFAFGDYRYFPGRGRELFVEIRYAAN